MKPVMILASIGLAFCACQRTEQKTRAPAWEVPSSVGVAARPACPPEADDAFFFPVMGLAQPSARFDDHRFRRKAYSEELRKMLEPSLSCGKVTGDAFRFTWIRSFHPPIAIRVSATRTSAALTATQMSGSGGYAPGAVVDQPHRELSSDEWKDLQSALARSDFWDLPSAREFGPDGAVWVVEGRVGSRYYVVERWSPRSGSFRDLGLLFIKLSRLSVPERDIY